MLPNSENVVRCILKNSQAAQRWFQTLNINFQHLLDLNESEEHGLGVATCNYNHRWWTCYRIPPDRSLDSHFRTALHIMFSDFFKFFRLVLKVSLFAQYREYVCGIRGSLLRFSRPFWVWNVSARGNSLHVSNKINKLNKSYEQSLIFFYSFVVQCT